MRLAVIILTKNEEHNIEGAVKSASFADEVVVLDSGSTDRTQEIAERLGVRFVVHPMTEEGFAGQRNAALDETDADWVFYLDADERITDEAAKALQETVARNLPAVYRMKRINSAFGQQFRHGALAPNFPYRLFPRTEARWQGKVHEYIVSDLERRKVGGHLLHHTYMTWQQYFAKMNQYSSFAAREQFEMGKRIGWVRTFSHAGYAFFRHYVMRRGFLDGTLGFVLCALSGVYVMAKYMKLMNLWRMEDGKNGKPGA